MFQCYYKNKNTFIKIANGNCRRVKLMIGWHHRLNGHEFEQTLEVGDGQGSLACCSPWGCKESDMTEQLNWLTEVSFVHRFTRAWKLDIVFDTLLSLQCWIYCQERSIFLSGNMHHPSSSSLCSDYLPLAIIASHWSPQSFSRSEVSPLIYSVPLSASDLLTVEM